MIGESRFKKLYKLWIGHYIDQRDSFDVLVYYVDNTIVGFVTLGEKNNRADIGLIAVDSKHRGKGIGKVLMQSAENVFISKGYSSIQVVTQGTNFQACRFYQKCNYTIESAKYFYHIWKND